MSPDKADVKPGKRYPVSLHQGRSGFSLAEVLITLGIIGLLAVFTIPNMRQMSQASKSSKYTAIAKNTALMMVMAYERYKVVNPKVATTVIVGDLTPYMNYLSVDSTSTVDDHPTVTTTSCSSPIVVCLKLHNGATLWYQTTQKFGGTSPTNALWFNLDPDGSDSVPGSAISIFLYYDGTIRSKGTGKPNTYTNGSLKTTGSLYDPAWFEGF